MPLLPYPEGKGISSSHDPLSGFTRGHQSRVRMPSPSPPGPLPPTTCPVFRTWVPSREDSPCSRGVAMVLAHRTPNPDCPAVALAAGQAYSAAGLIPSRLSWVWTCPPLACCRLLLPNPSPATGQRCQRPRGAPPLSPGSMGAGSATWRRELIPRQG